ncbi:MAG: radical SAM family heme chaperone HemW [Chloroflexota bacterium]
MALYIHVPFCRARCTYCDFTTYVGLESLMPTYVRALCREIETEATRWNSPRVSTIYVGGGTPSLLPLEYLTEVLRTVRAEFDTSTCHEFTIEVNPGTVSDGYLSGLRSLGVNRLSIGVQSADEQELQMLGRIHGWREAVDIVAAARRSGFDNLSLDLLLGLPGQRLRTWLETLRRVLSLHPQHLSLYGLSLEEGTPLAERVVAGRLPAPDEAVAAAMYELAEEVLFRNGFFHYEISNWALVEDVAESPPCRWWPEEQAKQSVSESRPSRSENVGPYVCRHNLTYWRNQPWLGVGAGAHSWMPRRLGIDVPGVSRDRAGGRRWANPDHPEEYAAAAYASDDLLWQHRDIEHIGRQLEMGETMMLGLRLAEGINAEEFLARFGVGLQDLYGSELGDLSRLGLLSWDGEVARLTRRGRLLGNQVFERFLR